MGQSENQKEKLTNIAKYVINKMKEEDVIVQRYNAYSTNSIYLKFDFGVAWSLRISDHKGYEYLHYRYNIGAYTKNVSTPTYPGQRYFVDDSKESVDRMIGLILGNRKNKINSIGIDNYIKKLRYAQYMGNKKQKGFWAQATVV